MENEIRENSGTPYLVTVVLLGILAILYFLVDEFYFVIPVGIILLASCIRLQLKITRSHLHYSVFPFVHRKLALEDIRSYDIKELIEKLADQANELTDDVATRQYYLPMGFKIANHLSGDLPALVYLVELRATSLVHPTLAVQAAEMAKLLEEKFKAEKLAIHLESEPGRFDTKRGDADIVKKD